MTNDEIEIECDRYEALLRAGELRSVDEFVQERALPHNERLLAALSRVLHEHTIPKTGLAATAPRDDRHHELPETAKHLSASPSSTQIGSYKLLQPIGEGGMGTVYMAEQVEPLRRKVALKIIKPGMDSRQVIARFEAERQALAMMDHQNIAKVLDAGATDRGLPFFVMELVKGIPITKYCDDNRLTIDERLELFVPLCQAIQHAHQKGIIHRDIKPSNILVCNFDGQPVPKVIDFGVSKAVEQQLTKKTMFTQYGQVIGTLEYMSPEQAGLSQLDVDTRSDIYSLGVLLYELLTGSTPLTSQQLRQAGFEETMRLIREQEPQRPSTRLSGSTDSLPTISAQRRIESRKLGVLLRGELDWIVMKSLDKDRTRRYETAISLAQDVQRYLSKDVVEARPPSTLYQLSKIVRRHSRALAAIGLVMLAIATTVGAIGWSLRDRAVRQALARKEREDRRERLSDQVERILDEIHHLESEQKWEEALDAGRRAEAVAASGPVPIQLLDQIARELKDLEFLEQLDEIRMRRAVSIDGEYDEAGAIDAYGQAFRDFGVDVDSITAEDAVSRMKKHEPILRPLATAIDDYRDARYQEFGDADDDIQNRLYSILRQLDPSPTLQQVLSGKPTTADSQDELRQWAKTINVSDQSPANLLSLARNLYAEGLEETQHELLKRAQRQYPDDFWINHTLAETYDDRNDLEGAARFFTAAVATRPSASVAYLNLGSVLSDLGRHFEAVECIQRAVELDPNDQTSHYLLGLAHVRGGNMLKAEHSFRRAIALDPNDSEAHINLGVVFAKQKRTEDAEACYRRAIRLNPRLDLAHFNLGSLLRGQRRYEEAESSYRTAIQLDPKKSAYQFNLGNLLHDQGRYEDAESTYRVAIQLDPKKSLYHRYLGRTLAARKILDESEKCFRVAIELDSSSAPAHNSLGILFFDQGRYEDAESCFRKAFEIKPETAIYQFNLGNALARQGKLVPAEASYRQAIELDSDRPATHNALGQVLVKQRRMHAAETSFRSAIALDATNAKYQSRLASALKAQSKFRESEKAYRQAINLNPLDPSVHNSLGVLLYNQRRSLEAETCFRAAIDLDSQRAFYHFNLGNALRQQKKFPEAEVSYSRAIDLDPNNLLAHRALGKVLWDKEEFERAIAVCSKLLGQQSDNAAVHNQLAWWLVTCPNERLRDAPRGLQLASRATELEPTNRAYRNTLGVAHYTIGDLDKAIEELTHNVDDHGVSGHDGFVLAMAHWKLDQKDLARLWFDRAVKWMGENVSDDKELQKIHKTAAALLGITDAESDSVKEPGNKDQ